MPTPVPSELLPQSLRTSPKVVPVDLLPEGLRPQKELGGFWSSLFEGASTLGLADEAKAFAENPNEKTRNALIKAGESKYRSAEFGEGENWAAFKQLLGGSIGQLLAPVGAGLAGSLATPVTGLAAASATAGTQYTTQNLLRQAQEQQAAIARGETPEATSVGKAVLAATGQTALDLAGGKVFSGIAKAFPFMKPLVGQGSSKAVQEAGEVFADAAKNGTIKFVGGVATGVGKGVAFEVPQEIAQQGLERWQAGLSLTDEEARGEYGQAAIGALLLGGGLGGIEGGIRSRARPAAEPEAAAEEAPLPELAKTTGVQPEATLARLSEAAGPEISPGARVAVEALNRRISNDLALGTPESIAQSQAFITAREDELASGMKYPEDIAEPYTRALAEAKRMVEEAAPVAPVVQPAASVEPAPVIPPVEAVSPRAQFAEQVAQVAPATPVAAAPEVAPAAPVAAAPEVAPLDRKVAFTEANNRYPDDDLSATAFYNGATGATPDTLFNQYASDLEKQAFSEGRAYAQQAAPITPAAYVDRYMAGEGRGTSPADLELQQYAANFPEEIEAEFARRTEQGAANAPIGERGAPVDTGAGASVPPIVEPVPVGTSTAELGGIEPGTVDVGGGITPPPPAGAGPELDTLTPPPSVPPQRVPLQTPNKWLVKLADRYGMSKPLDTFVKSNLGYESLPEALETTSKLELSTTEQAGKERNLQRNFFDPIVDTAANRKADLGDFGFFLWARSAEGRNRVVAKNNPEEFPEGGSGLTTAQAAEGLQRLRDEGKLPAFNQLARKVDELVDFNLEEDIKAGLLSREGAEQLREEQPFYVPLKGFAKDGDMLTADIDEDANGADRQEEAMQALRAAAPTGSVSEFRKAFGRGDMPFHPLFNLFQDSEARVRRRVINKALQPVLRAYKQDPAAFSGIMNVYSDMNPKRVMVSRDLPGGRYEPIASMEREYRSNPGKYMLVKENGVPYYIEFAEKGPGAELKRMFTNMRPEDMSATLQTVANINNFMKGMLTYKNPLYLMFVAPFRDTAAAVATAMANQNIKGSPAYKKNLAAKTFFYAINPTTWATISRYVFGKAPMNDSTGKLLEEMIDLGGAPLHTRFMNVQEKAGAAARAVKTLQGTENLSPKERAANLWEGLNGWIDGLADVMDMSARFATYRAATDLGIQPRDAARLALDSSLNLTRRGEMARNLDLVIPFFGAGVESSRKTLRILTNPKALAKVFGTLIALGVLESMWNSGQSGDSDDDGREDYLDQDLGAGLRMSRFIIYFGSGPDDYIKVPLDPMLGYFKFVGNKIGDLMAGAITPDEATTGLIPGFISLMSPLRVPGTDVQSLTTAVTPLMGKPFVENIFNENFFGSPIYTEAFPGGAPRSELGRASTGDFWKGLAKVINDATGGSEAVSGGADFQPEVYRHIIESYFGGPYQLAKQMVGLKEAEGMADVPGIKSFVGTGSEYAPQSKYFENTTIIRQIMNRLSKLTPEQQMAQGAEFTMDTDPRVIDAFRAVEANLDRINKEQKASLALAKTDEDKRTVLDYYRAEKNQYYSAFNAVFNAVKKGE